jgi:hypothetical protein
MGANNFFQIYNDLPTRNDQKIIRDRIISEAKIDRQTFYSWFRRKKVSDLKAQAIIAKILNIPMDELFN